MNKINFRAPERSDDVLAEEVVSLVLAAGNTERAVAAVRAALDRVRDEERESASWEAQERD